jgi:hypothetical protein
MAQLIKILSEVGALEYHIIIVAIASNPSWRTPNLLKRLKCESKMKTLEE